MGLFTRHRHKYKNHRFTRRHSGGGPNFSKGFAAAQNGFAAAKNGLSAATQLAEKAASFNPVAAAALAKAKEAANHVAAVLPTQPAIVDNAPAATSNIDKAMQDINEKLKDENAELTKTITELTDKNNVLESRLETAMANMTGGEPKDLLPLINERITNTIKKMTDKDKQQYRHYVAYVNKINDQLNNTPQSGGGNLAKCTIKLQPDNDNFTAQTASQSSIANQSNNPLLATVKQTPNRQEYIETHNIPFSNMNNNRVAPDTTNINSVSNTNDILDYGGVNGITPNNQFTNHNNNSTALSNQTASQSYTANPIGDKLQTHIPFSNDVTLNATNNINPVSDTPNNNSFLDYGSVNNTTHKPFTNADDVEDGSVDDEPIKFDNSDDESGVVTAPNSSPNSSQNIFPNSSQNIFPNSSQNSFPNSSPDSSPNSFPNSSPDSSPNSSPNSSPDSSQNSSQNSSPNSSPNSFPNSSPNSSQNSSQNIFPNSSQNSSSKGNPATIVGAASTLGSMALTVATLLLGGEVEDGEKVKDQSY